MTRKKHRRAGFAILFVLVAAIRTYGEVILELKNGDRFIGETVQAGTGGVYLVQVYRDFIKALPMAGVMAVRTNDPSLSADPTVSAARLHARQLVSPPPGALSANDHQRLEKLVKLYFASPTNREPVLRTLQGMDAIPLAETKAWAALAFACAQGGPKLTSGDTVFPIGEQSGKVHVELWRKSAPPTLTNTPAIRTTTNATAAELTTGGWPVLITLHGGGENDGAWQSGGPTFFKLFTKHFDRLIFVAPTVLQKKYAEWGSNPNEELFVRELLKAVKRTWPVDTDRVFLTGVSMGGYGTWHIGGHEADTFAGLISNAGGILLGRSRGETWGWGTIGNLMHTPIAFLHGGKDEPAPPWSDTEADRMLTALAREHPGLYQHKYTFLPSAGHSVPGKAVAEAVQWIAPFVRNPAPTKLQWEPSRVIHRSFFWLRTDQPRMFTRLEAAVTNNTFTIHTTSLPGGFSVWLDPRLVDLAKPVTILVNDQPVFQAQVSPTLSAILESVDDKNDPQMWYPARVDF